MKASELKEILIGLAIKILVMLGILWFCNYFNFPIGLTASFLLFVFLAILSIMEYKKFKTAQKVGIIGVTISVGLLSALFAYDHFIENIRITAIHISLIILPPLLIGSYLIQKDKKT